MIGFLKLTSWALSILICVGCFLYDGHLHFHLLLGIPCIPLTFFPQLDSIYLVLFLLFCLNFLFCCPCINFLEFYIFENIFFLTSNFILVFLQTEFQADTSFLFDLKSNLLSNYFKMFINSIHFMGLSIALQQMHKAKTDQIKQLNFLWVWIYLFMFICLFISKSELQRNSIYPFVVYSLIHVPGNCDG